MAVRFKQRLSVGEKPGEDSPRKFPGGRVEVSAYQIAVRGPTGVEMEALCGVSAALLTVYDGSPGGTGAAVDYARRMGKPVMGLWL